MSEKDKHIDWMNEQDDNAAFVRAAKEEDFASMVEMAPEPVLAEGVDLGRLFDRMRAPRDWAGAEFADAVYGPIKSWPVDWGGAPTNWDCISIKKSDKKWK